MMSQYKSVSGNVRSQVSWIQTLYVGLQDGFRVRTPVRTAAPRQKNLTNRFSNFYRLFPTFSDFFMEMLGKLENVLNFNFFLLIPNSTDIQAKYNQIVANTPTYMRIHAHSSIR
jgi:hypothetical protein